MAAREHVAHVGAMFGYGPVGPQLAAEREPLRVLGIDGRCEAHAANDRSKERAACGASP